MMDSCDVYGPPWSGLWISGIQLRHRGQHPPQQHRRVALTTAQLARGRDRIGGRMVA
jgi:hypothetical protein